MKPTLRRIHRLQQVLVDRHAVVERGREVGLGRHAVIDRDHLEPAEARHHQPFRQAGLAAGSARSSRHACGSRAVLVSGAIVSGVMMKAFTPSIVVGSTFTFIRSTRPGMVLDDAGRRRFDDRLPLLAGLRQQVPVLAQRQRDDLLDFRTDVDRSGPAACAPARAARIVARMRRTKGARRRGRCEMQCVRCFKGASPMLLVARGVRLRADATTGG